MKRTQNVRQVCMEAFEKPIKKCAFTGHRELGGDFDREKLKEMIRRLCEKGTDTFFCGMAKGFDLAAAEEVLSLKREFPEMEIKLYACIPCEGQERGYSAEDKERYAKILKECDDKAVLAERYYRGCMLRRNGYMEERSDALIAYCRKDTGGTAYTRNLFLKKNKPVFDL